MNVAMNFVRISWETGALEGPGVRESSKRLRELAPLFRDSKAAADLDPDTVVCRVKSWMPVAEGADGGLFWGTTTIEPGKVGDEYFMTHGHFHATRNKAEFYATLRGEGALILMDETGRTWFEAMNPGTVHYIPGGVAHRVANTGAGPLAFAACWPSDAGHDYAVIRARGFGARLREVNGRPMLVPEEDYARTGD
jgi:glucose-6-phosphate isomerase